MKGLLYKDLCAVWKYCRIYLILVVVIALAGAVGPTDKTGFFTLYPSLLVAMIPMTLWSYDERDKFNQYCCAMPVSRAQYVSARYVMGLLCVGLMTALKGLASLWLLVTGGWDGQLGWLGAGVAVALVFPAIYLPFICKLGVERGRLFYTFLAGALIAVAGIAIGVASVLNDQSAGAPYAWIAAGAAAVLYGLSWRLSIHFYKKREL